MFTNIVISLKNALTFYVFNLLCSIMRYQLYFILFLSFFIAGSSIKANKNIILQLDTITVKKLADSSSHYAFTNSLKSITFGKKALELALKLKSLKSQSYAHMSLARAYYVKGEYENSLSHGSQLRKISKRINYGYGLAFAVNNAGLIYLGQEQHKLALEEFNKALELNKSLNNLVGQSSNLFNIALCEINFKNYEVAANRLQECLLISEKANPRVYIMAINRLGDVAYERKQWKEAMSFYEKALIENTIGDNWEKAYAYLGMSIVLYDKGSYKQSIANAEVALALLKQINAHWDMIRVYDILHKSSDKLGQYTKAYEYLKLYKTYNDSLYNEKKEKEINTLHLKQKAIENKELAQQVELRKQSNRVSQLIILVISVVVIFLTGGVIFILKNNRKISQLNKELTKGNEDIAEQRNQIAEQNVELERLNYSKDQLFSVIGHDLRSPITSIIQTVDLLRSNSLSIEETEYIYNSFFERLTATATMLDNLLLWVNNQKRETTIDRKNFLLPKLTEQLLLVLNFPANEKGVHINHQYQEDIWINADTNHVRVRIIIQNLVSNAIKFTPSGGNIYIHYFVKEDKVGIVIKDTGVGISKEKLGKLFHVMGKEISTYGTANEKGIGIGLMLVKKYADHNNAQVIVNSDESGAEFVVCFDRAN